MPALDLSTITLQELTDLIQDACTIYQLQGGRNTFDAMEQTQLPELFGNTYDIVRDTINDAILDSDGKGIRFLMDDFDNTLEELDDVTTDHHLKQDIENFLYKSPLAQEVRLEQMYRDSCGIAQSLFQMMDRELSEEEKEFAKAQEEKAKEPQPSVEQMQTYKEYASLVVTATAAELTEKNKELLEQTEIKGFLAAVQEYKDSHDPIRTVDADAVEKAKETPQVEERVKISMDKLKTKVEEPKLTAEQELENRMNNFINKSLTKDEIARANKRELDVFDLLSINGEALSSDKWPTRMDKLKAMDEQLQAKECVDVCHVSKNGKKIETTRNFLVTPEDKKPIRENYSAFRLWLHDMGWFKINGFEDKMRTLSDQFDFEQETRMRHRPVERQLREKIYAYEDKVNPITSFAKARRAARDEKLDKQEEKEVQERYEMLKDKEYTRRDREDYNIHPMRYTYEQKKMVREFARVMKKEAIRLEREQEKERIIGIPYDALVAAVKGGEDEEKAIKRLVKEELKKEKEAQKRAEKAAKQSIAVEKKAKRMIAAYNKKKEREAEKEEEKQLKLQQAEAKAKAKAKGK